MRRVRLAQMGQEVVVETDAGDEGYSRIPCGRRGLVFHPIRGHVGGASFSMAGGPPVGSFSEHDATAWEAAIQTNLLGVVRFCKAVAPDMKSKNWGRIISITSTVAKEPSPAMVLSATTRAGVSAFSKTLAIELAQFNISVNVICPGGVLTDRLVGLLQARAEREKRDYQEVLQETQASIPAKRFAEPQEIADVILFLASERGGYVNGVSLSVDGALTKAYT